MVLMAVLMSVAIQFVVDRPIRRFMDAISPVATTAARPWSRDDVGRVRRAGPRFNEMVARIERFNEELQTRVPRPPASWTALRQVEQLNALLYELQRRLVTPSGSRSPGG